MDLISHNPAEIPALKSRRRLSAGRRMKQRLWTALLMACMERYYIIFFRILYFCKHAIAFSCCNTDCGITFICVLMCFTQKIAHICWVSVSWCFWTSCSTVYLMIYFIKLSLSFNVSAAIYCNIKTAAGHLWKAWDVCSQVKGHVQFIHLFLLLCFCLCSNLWKTPDFLKRLAVSTFIFY